MSDREKWALTPPTETGLELSAGRESPVYTMRTGPECTCGHAADKHLQFSGVCVEDCLCVEYEPNQEPEKDGES